MYQEIWSIYTFNLGLTTLNNLIGFPVCGDNFWETLYQQFILHANVLEARRNDVMCEVSATEDLHTSPRFIINAIQSHVDHIDKWSFIVSHAECKISAL